MAGLTEQGLYFFLARSDKPKALPFQMWLADEVMPSIRKYGAFLTADKLAEVLLTPDNMIKLAQNLKAEQEARRLAESKLALAEPKAELVDAAFARRHEQPLRLSEVVRKLDGVNTQAIKRDLAVYGYLYKTQAQYRVYSHYRDSHFVEKFNPLSGKQDIYATDKGAALIARLYHAGKLTMKQGACAV
jgi:hypothetical protein